MGKIILTKEEIIEHFEDLKAGYEELLEICKKAVEDGISPREVWLNWKEKFRDF